MKVLGSDGSGFNSWVAAGILWAVDNGARVINTSLGSFNDDMTVAAAAQYAALHGVLVVAAAGNDGSSTLQYPAALPGVLSVSASDQSDHLVLVLEQRCCSGGSGRERDDRGRREPTSRFSEHHPRRRL